MIGMGTVINVLAIILGGSMGLLIKNGISQRFKEIIMQTLGLAVIIIGLSGALQGIYRITEDGQLSREYIMLMILSLVVGGIIGELLAIEANLEKMAKWIQKRFGSKEVNFAQGFITSTLVYCVGAMAIVGSLEDGLLGNPATLFAKSILDGVSAVVFAASMGIGVLFSSIPVGIYQGGITFMAELIKPWLTDIVISQTSLVGGVLIMAIGINLLDIKIIRVANMLPAIFIPFVYYVITSLY